MNAMKKMKKGCSVHRKAKLSLKKAIKFGVHFRFAIRKGEVSLTFDIGKNSNSCDDCLRIAK